MSNGKTERGLSVSRVILLLVSVLLGKEPFTNTQWLRKEMFTMNIWLSFHQVMEELSIAFFAFQKSILNLEVRLQNCEGLMRWGMEWLDCW